MRLDFIIFKAYEKVSDIFILDKTNTKSAVSLVKKKNNHSMSEGLWCCRGCSALKFPVRDSGRGILGKKL